ncbi:U1 zinc finger [Fragilaria crotonensis]|nr:U1 zinc finger [Fragilaria crotonensis]
MSSSSKKGGREPWRSGSERHYCTVCNSWMGSDRQSILLHEQGKKHKENVDKALEQRRLDRKTQDQSANALQTALANMTAAAVSSHMNKDVDKYGVSALHAVAAMNQSVTTKQDNVTSHQFGLTAVAAPNKEDQKAAWISKKSKREEEKQNEKDGENDDEPETKKMKRSLAPDEGNYAIGDRTYLEGVTFFNLLDHDMPIEVWTGAPAASLAEKRLPEKQHYWRPGLVIGIRKSSLDLETGKVLDVSFLKSSTDTDETLEKSVLPNRIRMILGSDDSLPESLEEARIAAMGGQVVAVLEPEREQQETLALDENTGLSTWGTIEIRKTTVRQELKDERERVRLRRREEARRLEEELKRAEGRRMEEARVDNAEDSALGAYDVWNNGKEGYKGVNILATDKMTAADAAGTSLSGGKKVEFKKKGGFQKKAKAQNRRTTSADDL